MVSNSSEDEDEDEAYVTVGTMGESMGGGGSGRAS